MEDRPTTEELALFRLGTFTPAVGLALGYAITVPLKAFDMLPSHITWVGVALAPAAIFGLVGSLFAGRLWLGHRWWMLFAPVAIVSLTTLAWLNLARP